VDGERETVLKGSDDNRSTLGMLSICIVLQVNIYKGSVSCLYVMILPCILVTRQEHILSFLCVYF
jgi:hypothetical protein